MWNKLKNSLVVQIGFLFVLSFVFTCLLWLFFYTQQNEQQNRYNTNRYLNIANTLQPLLIQAIPIYDEDLSVLDMKLYVKTIPKNYKLLFKKGNAMRGFEVFEFANKKLLFIYNHIDEVLLEDTQQTQNTYIIHIVFLILLASQALLSIRVQKLLRPLSLMRNKLHTLTDGDLTALSLDTCYDEVEQMVSSYNKAVTKIQYILDTKEMFNKIFMHEIKTPIAKAMFYLKLEPTKDTKNKLEKILYEISHQLDEFSQLENLISHKGVVDNTAHNISNIIDEAIAKTGTNNTQNIHTICPETTTIKGDRDLWVLCFKNIINNALSYSPNNQVQINYKDSKISFVNIGESLPIDISKDIKNWKLARHQRDKSSTGYGFGLFIIKTIVVINKYKLNYTYDEQKRQINMTISKPVL